MYYISDKDYFGSVKNAAEHGTIVSRASGRNWDYVLYNDNVYYLAVVSGCGSGWFGSLLHWNRYQQRELDRAVKAYRKQWEV